MNPRRMLGCALLLPLLLGATPSARAAGRPAPGSASTLRHSVLGSWRLDVAHSDFGPNASSKPRQRIDRWDRVGEVIHVHSVTVQAHGDTLRLDWDVRSDGGRVVNTMMGVPVATVGRDEDGVLHIVFSAGGGFGSIVTDERWTVSADGATLTLERVTRGPAGAFHQRYVFRHM